MESNINRERDGGRCIEREGEEEREREGGGYTR